MTRGYDIMGEITRYTFGPLRAVEVTVVRFESSEAGEILTLLAEREHQMKALHDRRFFLGLGDDE